MSGLDPTTPTENAAAPKPSPMKIPVTHDLQGDAGSASKPAWLAAQTRSELMPEVKHRIIVNEADALISRPVRTGRTLDR